MKGKIFILIVFAFLLFGGLYAYSNKLGFAAYSSSSQYYIPLYTSIICDKLPEITIDSWDLSDYETGFFGTEKELYCSKDVKGWFPQGCGWNIESTDSKLGYEISKCESQDCRAISGGLIFNKAGRFSEGVQTSQYGGIGVKYSGANTLLDKGDLMIKTYSQGYGIWELQGNGKITILPTCDLDKLSTRDYKGEFPEQSSNLEAGHILRIGFVHDIISGQIPVQSPRSIVNKNGQAVYIEGTGGYYPTFGENGNVYVDIRPESFVKDTSIICSPASPLCNDDGTAWQTSPQGKFCDRFVGISNSYVQKDTTTACKMGCNEQAQKLEFTDDCTKISSTCPANKPFFNSITGECVAVGSVEGATKETPIILYVMAGVILLLFAILIGIAIRKKHNGGW